MRPHTPPEANVYPIDHRSSPHHHVRTCICCQWSSVGGALTFMALMLQGRKKYSFLFWFLSADSRLALACSSGTPVTSADENRLGPNQRERVTPTYYCIVSVACPEGRSPSKGLRYSSSTSQWNKVDIICGFFFFLCRTYTLNTRSGCTYSSITLGSSSEYVIVFPVKRSWRDHVAGFSSRQKSCETSCVLH